MSRPESAAGSNPGTTQLVKPPSQRRPLGPSNITLFVANLRLLNLDQRPDWPDITVTTFDTKDVHQNAKKRISCVEWSLYRLFELWDHETTRDKLQPFFPPLEPLQSLNLRAALFRCLNELRKSDILGREAILRKTMLDDCKGEKFEEVLLLFSVAVVRKHVQSPRRKQSFSIAKNLALAKNIHKNDLKSSTPLILAIRASLSKTLTTRADLDLAFNNFRQTLYERQEIYQGRHRDLQQSTKHNINPDTIASLQRDLRQNWIGGGDGCEALLSGGKAPTSDAYLDSDYDPLWHHVRQGTEPTAAPESVSLLENLQHRVEDQQKRLTRWREYSEQPSRLNESTLSDGKTSNGTDKDTSATDDLNVFTRHKYIRIMQKPLETSRDWITRDLQYCDTITDMAQALSRVGKDKRTRRTNTSQAKAAPVMDTPRTRGGAERVPVPVLLSNSKGLENDFFSPLKQPLPEFDEFTPHTSRGGKAYHSPLLSRTQSDTASSISQIHLGSKQNKHTPLRTQSLPTEDQSSLVDDSVSMSTPQQHTNYHITRQQPTSFKESISSLDEALDQMQIDDATPQPSENSTQSLDHHKEATQYMNRSMEEPSSPPLASPSPPLPPHPVSLATEDRPIRPTLSERARISMSFRSNESIPTISTLTSPIPEDSTPQPSSSHNSSLADRTRQSISLAYPPTISEPQDPVKRHHDNDLHPQHFLTPKKSNPSKLKDEDDVPTETTPKDKLFDQDAEYASVFKSRPRIAMSPVLTPAFGDRLDSDMGIDFTEEGEESAMNFGSSPLRKYGS